VFTAALASWQNFYILSGTAAATLAGLMFVAVTFGAGLFTPETEAAARAWLDPPFYHFFHILITAALTLMPTMSPSALGAIVVALSMARTLALARTYKRFREAHETYGDLELSDWLTGVVFPLLCYLALAASGAGFLAGYTASFTALAVAMLVMMVLGVIGAWELLLWLAIQASKKEPRK
jgi:hypothetical protein